MLVLVAGALRRGLDIQINWIGRLAVWPTMTGIAGALFSDSWVAEALLYLGIAGVTGRHGALREGRPRGPQSPRLRRAEPPRPPAASAVD